MNNYITSNYLGTCKITKKFLLFGQETTQHDRGITANAFRSSSQVIGFGRGGRETSEGECCVQSRERRVTSSFRAEFE